MAEGWARPLNSRSWHFFGADSIALCGKWLFMGELLPDNGEPSGEDCKSCRRKLNGRGLAKAEGK